MSFGQLTMPPFPDLPYIPNVLFLSVYLKGIARGYGPWRVYNNSNANGLAYWAFE